MKKLSVCPVCDKNTIVFAFKNKDRIHNISGEFLLWKCTRCGVFFVNPQLSQKELIPFYSTNYYSFNVVDLKNPVRIFELWYIKNILINQHFFVRFLAICLNPLLIILKVIKVRKFPYLKGGTLLDVGCGSGEFLAKEKYAGMNVIGVDPYANSKQFMEGISVYCTTLEKAPIPIKSVDIITLNHVLEHAENPKKMLSNVYALLKHTGTAVIAVPNTKSPTAKLFGKYWVHWDTPRHLILYTPSALKLLVERMGFSVLSVKNVSSCSAMRDSLLNLLKERKYPHWMISILQLRIVLPLLWPWYKSMCIVTGAGEHMEFMLQKVRE